MIDRLTTELKEIVFIDFLELKHRPSELREIATVCRALHHFLRPFLWHRIKLKAPSSPIEDNYFPCAKVLMALFPARQRPLNTHVRELIIKGEYSESDRPDDDDDSSTAPPYMISSDPSLPELFSRLPNLQQLSLLELDWSEPLLDSVIGRLAVPSLCSLTIATGAFPLELFNHLRHIKTLNLSADPEDPEAANVPREVSTPELRHLNIVSDPCYFYDVWLRLDTSKLETAVVPYGAGMGVESGDIDNTYPPSCASLQSLSIVICEDDGEAPWEDDSEDWPKFKSLAALREFNVSIATWTHDDWPRRLARWLGRLDAIMGNLEYLTLYLSIQFPDTIAVEPIEGLLELDSQLAHLQLTTLKHVVIGLCPNDPDGTSVLSDDDEGDGEDEDGDDEDGEVDDAGPDIGEQELVGNVEGMVLDGGRSGPPETEVSQEELETRTAASFRKMWDSLPASRARAPDFISIKVLTSESPDINMARMIYDHLAKFPWDYVFDG
ncbi:hypothetical protein H0H92_008829 [Tricholoma furcatifolium]|nr:hypothetical protein H0H92_008829 [Tricholoma furcatifolium]